MNLFDQAIKDAQSFVNRDFGVPTVFVAPTLETATVNSWTTKHHVGFDADGNQINSKTANVTVSEQDLTNAGYPVRDANGEVNMKGHLVTVKDSTQATEQFKVAQYYPDERLGLIQFILSEFT